MRRLLDSGADANAETRAYDRHFDSATPLSLAAQQGKTQVAKLLLDRGADLNKRDHWSNGFTPLEYAASNGKLETLQLLIARGAKIDGADSNCFFLDSDCGSKTAFTPLSLAALGGHPDVAQLLLSKGADLEAAIAILEHVAEACDQASALAHPYKNSAIENAKKGVDFLKRLPAERSSASFVSSRLPSSAPPERQARIDEAARSGDAAAKAGDAKAAFEAYSSALSGDWSDDAASRAAREKLLKLAASYPGLPEAPEEARRHAVRAKTALKDSQGLGSYETASSEFMQAIGAAPWWSTAYYNLALVQEKQGYVSDAIGNLKLYLLANPTAADARAVQDKIYALEMRLEKAQSGK